MVFSGYMPVVGLLDRMVVLYLVLKGATILFFIVAVLICVSLIISYVEHLFLCLLVILVFFGEMSI